MRNSAFAGPFSSLYETAPPYDPHIATAEHRGTKHLTLNHPPKERHRGGLCWLYSSVQFSNYEQLLRRVVLRFRGGLVFQAQRMLYHSTLGSRVIKKKIPVGGGPGPERGYQNLSGQIPKGVPRPQEKAPHKNPTVGLCLGPYGSIKGRGAFSDERGTPVSRFTLVYFTWCGWRGTS